MIVSTKLHIPRTGHRLVSRPRLIDKLNEGMRMKLTLLSAQAGFGKTTLLSQWSRQCDSPVAWVSLDKQDNDWIQFWSYVLASIRGIVPGFGAQTESYLVKGPSATSVSSEPVIEALLNELYQLSDRLAIVLDDYHLIDKAAINDSLNYLLERLPSHIHLYIASRNELHIPTARLLAKGEMQQIKMQELRFELEEGLVYFENKADLSLTKEQAAELLRQTEGWISGLQLAAISLKQSTDPAELIRKFGGRQHHIADYLLEEVLVHLEEPLRDFLLQTSILTRMNSSLCEAVTGQKNCQEQLAKLEKLNLFIIPLDDQRSWYRYHHLLSDYLQHVLASGDPDKRAQSHTRAARWLERHGYEEESAEHYMEGRQYDDVVRLLESNLQIFIYKKIDTLSRWVFQLPESFLLKRPMVEMFYLLLLLGTGQWVIGSQKIEQARTRYEALQGTIDEVVWKEIMGNIYFLCASSFYFQKDLSRMMECFDLADHYLPEGGLFEMIGDNNHYVYNESDDQLAYINDHKGAAVFLSKWINNRRHHRTASFDGTLYASYSKLLYEWNRLEEAEQCIGQMLKPGGKPLTARNLLQIYVSASRIQQTLGNPIRAAELLEQLKLQIESPDYELFMRKIEAEQACLSLRQGSIQDAAKWLERCGMAHSDEVSLSSVQEHLVLVRVLAACGRVEEAMFLSERLYQLLLKEDRLRDRIKVLILQSVTLHRSGQLEKAIVPLKSALRLAELEGFVRSFIDEGEPMKELLSACWLEQDRASRSYVEQLLQEWGVVLETAARSRVHVQCFGRFKLMVRRGDGEEPEWRTSKAEELLAYLVHHRGEAVDRLTIMDNLWGSLDAERAAAQLNQTAHFVRKGLSGIGIEGLLHHTRGLYKIDVERIDCDSDKFDKRVAAVSDICADNISECEQIAALYKGSYMEGNGYPWAEQTRSHFEEEYVSLALRMQSFYISRGSSSQAIKLLKKALKIAPWKERLHEALIQAYLLASDRTAAMKQYDALRRMLRSEFGLEPREAVERLLEIK